MPVLQKVRLFSVEQQRRDDAWLLSPAAIPIEEQVLKQLSEYKRAYGDIPDFIRMNPWSIIEMPGERWQCFPFLIEGRIISVPIIPDSELPRGGICLEVVGETQMAVEAVRMQ